MPRGIAIAIAILFAAGVACVFWVDPAPGIATFGGIIAGAAIALGATYTVETWKRNQLKIDIAAALYHELATRVARCCYDFKGPWIDYYREPIRMELFRAGIFAPEKPLIFRSNADKIALFGEQVPSALMAFYFRLWVLERDLENSRADAKAMSPYTLTEKAVKTISTRFWATLDPGFRALQSFESLVPQWAAIEAAAWKSVDIAEPPRATGTLRDNLRSMIDRAKELGFR